MNKKRIILYFIASLVVGLLLSACAGYASGQFTPNQTIPIGGPTIQVWQIPIFDFAQQDKVETRLGAQPKLFASYQAVEQTQTVFHEYGGLCNRP